jgi:hypothetical protein
VALENWDAAVSDYGETSKYATEGTIVEVRLALALTLAKKGDYDAALDEVRAQMETADPPSFVAFDAARVYAQLYITTENDDQLDQQERNRRNSEFLDMAIKALEKAAEGGYFASPATVRELQSRKEFDAIRDQTEFQNFVLGLSDAAKSSTDGED